MRLRDLDAKFIHDLKLHPFVSFRLAEELVGSFGIEFLCPKCFQDNSGKVGTHAIICWWAGKVPDDLHPKPGRWTPSGTSLDDLTFIPGNPPRATSVFLNAKHKDPATGIDIPVGCQWHGFVTNGEAA
jgi:hypothetical protein